MKRKAVEPPIRDGKCLRAKVDDKVVCDGVTIMVKYAERGQVLLWFGLPDDREPMFTQTTFGWLVT